MWTVLSCIKDGGEWVSNILRSSSLCNFPHPFLVLHKSPWNIWWLDSLTLCTIQLQYLKKYYLLIQYISSYYKLLFIIKYTILSFSDRASTFYYVYTKVPFIFGGTLYLYIHNLTFLSFARKQNYNPAF